MSRSWLVAIVAVVSVAVPVAPTGSASASASGEAGAHARAQGVTFPNEWPLLSWSGTIAYTVDVTVNCGGSSCAGVGTSSWSYDGGLLIVDNTPTLDPTKPNAATATYTYDRILRGCELHTAPGGPMIYDHAYFQVFGLGPVENGEYDLGFSTIYTAETVETSPNCPDENRTGPGTYTYQSPTPASGFGGPEDLQSVIATGDCINWRANQPGCVAAQPDRLVGSVQATWNRPYDLNTTTTMTFDLHADPVEPAAVALWRVVPRTLDEDADGLIDGYLDGSQSARVPRDGLYAVDLNGCSSTGDIGEYRWVLGAGAALTFTSSSCSRRVFLPERSYPGATLTVTGPGGSASVPFDVSVKDWLVVGLGDSYGSGEGAPDVAGGGTGSTSWAQEGCHRSTRSAQALTALRLEQADPHSSVTFIHLACSGATIPEGVVGSQPEPPGADRVAPTQVDKARRLAHGQAIDAVLLSIGGNDVGFSEIIETCAAHRRCPYTYQRAFGWDLIGSTPSAFRLHDQAENDLVRLRNRYARLARCLSFGPRCVEAGTGRVLTPLGVDPSHVFVTEYPSVATSDDGSFCDDVLGGIADEEFEWATRVVQDGVSGTSFTYNNRTSLAVSADGLNRQISGLGRLGWTPVVGFASAFVGHGYCADDHWVTQLNESLADEHAAEGTFHPNAAGYEQIAGQTGTPGTETYTAAQTLGITGTP